MSALISQLLPRKRRFVEPASSSANAFAAQHVERASFRLLQFNILADGLSGLRPDHGCFARTSLVDILWENRAHKLLHEITQYDPDCLCLQECDHYHDFFFPALSKLGYEGVFSPKPRSACLDVAPNPDGLAIFTKKSVMKIITTEVCT